MSGGGTIGPAVSFGGGLPICCSWRRLICYQVFADAWRDFSGQGRAYSAARAGIESRSVRRIRSQIWYARCRLTMMRIITVFLDIRCTGEGARFSSRPFSFRCRTR